MKCLYCKNCIGDACDLFPKLVISISTDWGNFCRYGRSKDDQKNPKTSLVEKVEVCNCREKTKEYQENKQGTVLMPCVHGRKGYQIGGLNPDAIENFH